jgi:23S rRNA (pseudouridine1915-N3)-methyltransferase
MKIEILAAGRLRSGPCHELVLEYAGRITWPLKITEIESRHRDESRAHADELAQIKERLSARAHVIALDERGKTLSSRELAKNLTDIQDRGGAELQFVIGGANGLDEDIRARAHLLLSFGRLTWPHMLARAMLLEQIYRCQQIQKNHPYHRD